MRMESLIGSIIIGEHIQTLREEEILYGPLGGNGMEKNVPKMILDSITRTFAEICSIRST